jgi:beta-glucanase (GH16 family)
LVALLFAGEIHASNILTNPGFESGSLTGWTTFGANNYILSGASTAHSGTYSYKVYGQFNTATNYTGIYQDNPSAPGAIYSADGWAYSLSSDSITGQDMTWVEVSFRDASYNALALYRSAVVSSNNIASFGGFSRWFDLQITNQCSFTNASALILIPGKATNSVTSLVAPPGTVYVRYQVVFEQGPNNNGGSMYYDDLTLNQTGGTVAPTLQWNIVWSDEFNGTNISTNNWTFEIGNNGGWGNSELEYYTGRTNNAYVDGKGLLHIVAQQESTNGYSFTSARMKTQGLYSTPTYGRFVWRAKLPTGFGMWPALWMMGTNFPVVGWPACGEIDVVENPGSNSTTNQSSLHYGTSGTVNLTGYYAFTGGDSITNFHTYELDWSPASEQFLVDGQLYETQNVGSPFNAPFFFIMNLAVGGTYPGTTSPSAIIASNTFPKEIQVDYVRVYEQTAPLQISTTQSHGSVVLTWPTNIVCHLQAQTNSLVGGNWSDLNNTTNPFVVAPYPGNVGVFYRLASP